MVFGGIFQLSEISEFKKRVCHQHQLCGDLHSGTILLSIGAVWAAAMGPPALSPPEEKGFYLRRSRRHCSSAPAQGGHRAVFWDFPPPATPEGSGGLPVVTAIQKDDLGSGRPVVTIFPFPGITEGMIQKIKVPFSRMKTLCTLNSLSVNLATRQKLLEDRLCREKSGGNVVPWICFSKGTCGSTWLLSPETRVESLHKKCRFSVGDD